MAAARQIAARFSVLALIAFLEMLLLSPALSQQTRRTEEPDAAAPSRKGVGRPYHATHRYSVPRSLSELVSSPAVGRELGVSEELSKRIVAARSEAVSSTRRQQLQRRYRNALQAFRTALRSGDEVVIAGRRQQLAEAEQERDRATAEEDQAVLAQLTPAQRRRLVQISLQYEGVRALARPEIAESAGLAEDQVAEIRALVSARREELVTQSVRGQTDPGAFGFTAKMKRVIEKSRNNEPLGEQDRRVLSEFSNRSRLRAEELDRFERSIDARIGQVLTRSQRQRFARMLGPDFDLRKLDPGSRPRTESGPRAPGVRPG